MRLAKAGGRATVGVMDDDGPTRYWLFRVAALVLLAGALALAQEKEEKTVADTPLLADTTFQNGVVVWDPKPGKHVDRGVLQPWPGGDKPGWGLAQWHSRSTLAGAKAETLPDGRVCFADATKRLVFGKDEGVVLSLDGVTEYQRKAPERGDPWPHMLLSQRRLLHHPSLPELAAVPFHIRYRLLEAEPFKAPGWHDKRHTAQTVFFVTVQNLNRQSKGYGDYLWFGIMLYDYRWRSPKAHMAPDMGSKKKLGTGKYIYTPAFARFSKESPHDKEWMEIEMDLLPMLKEALADAWKRGYLKDSHDIDDYRLGGMNMGWEITGPIKAAVQIERVSLDARLR